MTINALESYGSAVRDFRHARQQADLKELLSRLTGETAELLSFDEVRRKLKAQVGSDRGLHDIPLDAIVGSVGRYTDFTRDFLPRRDSDKDRWARVKIATSGLIGLPPIEVYKIGEVYFVQDGNHRVSVARQFHATYIQAYITEVKSRVPLTPDTQPDDLILKAEYSEFLEQTQLDKLRSDIDLSASIPGQYQVLLEHIEVHRYFMGIDYQREISYAEAVAHWYDLVYMPVIQIICEQGILRDFPGRTETDLYLWIAEHRANLEEQLGWQVKTEAAASHLSTHSSPKIAKWFIRRGSRLLDWIIPDALEGGPPAGEWRRAKSQTVLPEDRLFTDILVPVDGKESGWFALEQALIIAGRDNAQLHGLFIVSNKNQLESKQALEVQRHFNARCEHAGIAGNLTITWGEVSRQICQHAVWTDLVVMNLLYPPPLQRLARLGSGFHEMIQRCSRPILATPKMTSPLNRALLAYDGSPKAEEALFISAYLGGQWKMSLVVLSVSEDRANAEAILDHARQYLEKQDVQAIYMAEAGELGKKILNTAQAQQCDLLIMGGYRYNPVLEVLLGSVVNQMLRGSSTPVMVCR